MGGWGGNNVKESNFGFVSGVLVAIVAFVSDLPRMFSNLNHFHMDTKSKSKTRSEKHACSNLCKKDKLYVKVNYLLMTKKSEAQIMF